MPRQPEELERVKNRVKETLDKFRDKLFPLNQNLLKVLHQTDEKVAQEY